MMVYLYAIDVCWTLKGRYHLLASLVERNQGYELLEEFPTISADIIKCLSIIDLQSAATQVYVAYLKA